MWQFLDCFLKITQIRTSNFCKVVWQHTEGMVESIIWVLLEIYLAFQQWKNFENPLTMLSPWVWCTTFLDTVYMAWRFKAIPCKYSYSVSTNPTKFPVDSRTHCNISPVAFTQWWLCAHVDPVYLMDFTRPYLVLADNYWAASLITDITVILLTR